MAPKDPYQLLAEIAKILKSLHIPYMVTGGVAVLIWGRPRFTADIDMVVELKSRDVSMLAKNLKDVGTGSFIDEDVMKEALAQHGEFNFIEGDTGLKVDFWILNTNDDFDISRFKRIVHKIIGGERIAFTSGEDLILQKLKWYRESGSSRQLEDIESILNISGKDLDYAYLKKWAKIFDTFDTLNRLCHKKP